MQAIVIHYEIFHVLINKLMKYTYTKTNTNKGTNRIIFLHKKSCILLMYDERDKMKDLLETRKSIVTLRRIESILRMRINVLDLLHNHCTFMYVIT